ncbi:type I toxin-antitoxin system ptaRNA1 family toxin [Halomonas eurihalina]|uniref:Type I toxin-antitoxin system ptaRNA1 family toxin n=1 Tax=Halomonas eurihalina TaxID=42566 RepID=A0A5D9DD64_HALER|nr:type I toxin-antitoxin system ptaRNA1 family toxin [Halomonas eurihalina]MDR5857968.1 type I toxin-antitoxin system ptaRNA1 family toxin [Halomonas eurihalina]TZG41519.1 type I toxin-antitoxin system ptaRNA1 family toxin [Halomonas eurihalina]
MEGMDNIEVSRIVHHVATELDSMSWIDQETANQVSPIAEAVANMCTILFYQAETGLAKEDDFVVAKVALQEAIGMEEYND